MATPHADDTHVEGAPPSPTPVPPETKFEAALAELEMIVQKMEQGQLTLEESISAYHRGSELLKHCQKQLGDAERKIRILENGVLRELDESAGDAR